MAPWRTLREAAASNGLVEEWICDSMGNQGAGRQNLAQAVAACFPHELTGICEQFAAYNNAFTDSSSSYTVISASAAELDTAVIDETPGAAEGNQYRMLRALGGSIAHHMGYGVGLRQLVFNPANGDGVPENIHTHYLSNAAATGSFFYEAYHATTLPEESIVGARLIAYRPPTGPTLASAGIDLYDGAAGSATGTGGTTLSGVAFDDNPGAADDFYRLIDGEDAVLTAANKILSRFALRPRSTNTFTQEHVGFLCPPVWYKLSGSSGAYTPKKGVWMLTAAGGSYNYQGYAADWATVTNDAAISSTAPTWPDDDDGANVFGNLWKRTARRHRAGFLRESSPDDAWPRVVVVHLGNERYPWTATTGFDSIKATIQGIVTETRAAYTLAGLPQPFIVLLHAWPIDAGGSGDIATILSATDISGQAMYDVARTNTNVGFFSFTQALDRTYLGFNANTVYGDTTAADWLSTNYPTFTFGGESVTYTYDTDYDWDMYQTATGHISKDSGAGSEYVRGRFMAYLLLQHGVIAGTYGSSGGIRGRASGSIRERGR